MTPCPWSGAAVVASLPKGRELAKLLALGWSLVVLVLGVAGRRSPSTPAATRFQLQESYTWIPTWAREFTFAVDGIALVMLLLIALLVPLVILA